MEMLLGAEIVPEFNSLGNLKEGKKQKKTKKPCISKDVKRGLCSLRMEGSKKTLFVAAGEEKKKAHKETTSRW